MGDLRYVQCCALEATPCVQAAYKPDPDRYLMKDAPTAKKMEGMQIFGRLLVHAVDSVRPSEDFLFQRIETLQEFLASERFLIRHDRSLFKLNEMGETRDSLAHLLDECVEEVAGKSPRLKTSILRTVIGAIAQSIHAEVRQQF